MALVQGEMKKSNVWPEAHGSARVPRRLSRARITLLDMLVVIGIIAILTALLNPVFQKIRDGDFVMLNVRDLTMRNSTFLFVLAFCALASAATARMAFVQFGLRLWGKTAMTSG
jgi:hypothetical protein